MATLDLSATFTRNPRTRALLDGSVVPEGIRLTATAMDAPQMFWRQLKFAEFDVSEMSCASFMIATSHGPTDWVGLPVFTMRHFFHTRILVREGAGIETPADLKGKRVGVPEYQQTAAVWSRGVLQDEFGVAPADMEWFMERLPERSHGGATDFRPPAGIRFSHIPAESSMTDMVAKAELDAVLLLISQTGGGVDRSAGDPAAVKLKPLFADPLAEGRRFYAKTGIYPINHCFVVRRSVYERHPWVALNVFNAATAARDVLVTQRAELLGAHLDVGALGTAADTGLAAEPMTYGVRSTRPVLETISRYLLDQGLTARRVELEEIFAKQTLDL